MKCVRFEPLFGSHNKLAYHDRSLWLLNTHSVFEVLCVALARLTGDDGFDELVTHVQLNEFHTRNHFIYLIVWKRFSPRLLVFSQHETEDSTNSIVSNCFANCFTYFVRKWMDAVSVVDISLHMTRAAMISPLFWIRRFMIFFSAEFHFSSFTMHLRLSISAATLFTYRSSNFNLLKLIVTICSFDLIDFHHSAVACKESQCKLQCIVIAAVADHQHDRHKQLHAFYDLKRRYNKHIPLLTVSVWTRASLVFFFSFVQSLRATAPHNTHTHNRSEYLHVRTLYGNASACLLFSLLFEVYVWK